MKKIIAVVLIVFSIIACSTSSDGYTVNGKITGLATDSSTVYLKFIDSTNTMISVDTTQIVGGDFKFTGNKENPELYYLVVDGIRGNLPIILENGIINLNVNKDSLQFASATGTVQNDFFSDFLSEQRVMQQMAQSMRKDMAAAQNAKDTAALSSLRDEFFELQEKSKDFNLEYVIENPNALVSALILESVLKTKGKTSKEVRDIYTGFTDLIKASKPGKRIEKELKKTEKTEVGAIAPKFSGPTPDGNVLALNDIKGKLTLVDFWAAWCKPCRAENPNIVAVYNKYKDKGLNVVGVSLDRKAEDWNKAIIEDGLTWNHISNLQYFNDPIAKSYGINAIPAAFLLDENGVIVAKNLRGAALDAKVAELLN